MNPRPVNGVSLVGRMIAAVGLAAAAAIAGDEPSPTDFRVRIEADWVAQEMRLGRSPESPEAIRHALDRYERLLNGLRQTSEANRAGFEVPDTGGLREQVEKLDRLDGPARLALYHAIRRAAREAALANPLLGGRPIVFLQRRRFVSQMLHEYLGYFYDYGDIAGGGVYILPRPGRSSETVDLIRGRLPRGNFTTLALSFDARTIYFAFAERAETKPDYYSPDRKCFHIFAMDADGENLRQLTNGSDDDFDPCPLPDGGVAFMSTRRGGFGRCHNPWEPLPTYTLHRMDADGRNIRTLSFHETNEWHPSVLADGRIVYIRWDYVDRSAANFHGLWSTNPDGTNAAILFGNYTMAINACYQPRAVPGSDRILFVAGAHHAVVGGSLVLLDPRRADLDARTGEDRFDALERLTPEVCFPETPKNWPSSWFHSPWPLSEDYYLVSFSFDPLPGMGPKVKEDKHTGLYLLDRFGNLELLYRDDGISSMYPIPLAPRPTPPVIPDSRDPSAGNTGQFVLADVNRSLQSMPPERRIRELRIFQILPKSTTHIANRPRIGYANVESARMLLGTVPVADDGSAWFTAPAGKPLYFQAVDAEGRAVQTMRSAVYLQPGERRGCVGCHEPPGITPAVATLSTARSGVPSSIRPGPDGSRPWSFPRLVQPVLDRQCIRCHDGTEGLGKSTLALAGGQTDTFSVSYENLRAYACWYEWGDRGGLEGFVTRPGCCAADRSPLTTILDDANHKAQVSLTDDDRRRIYLWLDGNAAFYGTYTVEEQLAQREGKAVPPPDLQ